MELPKYPNAPIYSINSLSRMLSEPPSVLQKLSAKADTLYRSVPQKKKDGSPRETFDAYEPLKSIQKKIALRLLNKTKYPSYLHGGVRDSSSPRSIYSNSRPHLGSCHIILLDIKDFYPSITKSHVTNIFQNFFGFSSDVSDILSRLLTKDGRVPQGACTSSHLANLIFWDVEPQLVHDLQANGFNYTRFADDITISSASNRDNKTTGEVVSKVISMLKSKNCYLKRSKFHIRSRGQSITGKDGEKFPLTITGLSIYNKSKPSISQHDRNNIRSSVKEIEVKTHEGATWSEIAPLYNRAMGRVGRLISCGHPEGTRLKNRLRMVKNCF
ncbi:MAG TPA: reverse transcriptase family protein [Pseudomonas sp.]